MLSHTLSIHLQIHYPWYDSWTNNIFINYITQLLSIKTFCFSWISSDNASRSLYFIEWIYFLCNVACCCISQVSEQLISLRQIDTEITSPIFTQRCLHDDKLLQICCTWYCASPFFHLFRTTRFLGLKNGGKYYSRFLSIVIDVSGLLYLVRQNLFLWLYLEFQVTYHEHLKS